MGDAEAPMVLDVPELLCLHAEVENLLGFAALVFLEDVRIVQCSWVAHNREALGGDAQVRFVERQDHVCVGSRWREIKYQ